MSSNNNAARNELLKPENMILLYSRGAFPMANDKGELNWYYPKIRTIIPLDEYNVPRSLRKFMETCDFEYRYDFNPVRIIKNCAKREQTWISDELIEAYKKLIKMDHLHTVEVYQKNKLVGGLYGVTNKGAFFGESMFSTITQASKCALIKLIKRLNAKGFVLLDVQFSTPHFDMFGAKEISDMEFNRLLFAAFMRDVSFC